MSEQPDEQENKIDEFQSMQYDSEESSDDLQELESLIDSDDEYPLLYSRQMRDQYLYN